jgi:hypothetical protein
VSSANEPLLVAWFDEEHEVLAACQAARRSGFSVEDVYAPYALHGVDEAMGLAPSRLTWVCFGAGLTGLVSMLWFEWWTQAVSWPLNVGGKPFNSLPAFIPVAFEFTVLCAALGTVAALLARAGLWPGKRRAVLPRVTDDRFALALTWAAGRDQSPARRIFAAHHASEVRLFAGAEVTP